MYSIDSFLTLILIPIIWFLLSLSYEIFNLIYLWIKDKISEIKDKEFNLWD
jgi:hypothetical protein